MSESAIDAGADFRIGSVIGRTWSILFAHFFSFLGITAVLVLLSLPVSFLQEVALGEASPALMLIVIVLMFVLSLAVMVVWGTILQGTVDYLAVGRAAIGAAGRRSLQRLLPFTLLMIVLWIVGSIAFFLFVIPGIIFACVYPLAPVACIVEGTGIFRSLSRSAELTRGHRWRILGLHAVNFLIILAAVAVIVLVIGVASALGEPIAVVIGAIAVCLSGPMIGWYSLISGAVLYHDLAGRPAGRGDGAHHPVL